LSAERKRVEESRTGSRLDGELRDYGHEHVILQKVLINTTPDHVVDIGV
jgi:hypothetical protein